MINSRASLRDAQPEDLSAIVAMLADDLLGTTRESADPVPPDSYDSAFAAIDSDPNHELVVAELDDTLVGVLQLSFLPGLTYAGGWRAQIEGVRVHSKFRGRGIGRELFEWATRRAREQGCVLVQLTTDKQRPDALRFYEGLGFTASHHGMKLHL